MELQTVEYVPFASILNHNIQNPVTLCLTKLCAEVLVLWNLPKLLQFLDLVLDLVISSEWQQAVQ